MKSQWPRHNLSTHNDLGWIDGTPKPVRIIFVLIVQCTMLFLKYLYFYRITKMMKDYLDGYYS